MAEQADADRKESRAGDGEPPLLDLAILKAQTFGDGALEREVLTLFIEHLEAVEACLPGEGGAEFLHKLRGAASSVGAVAIARHCGGMEHLPHDPSNWETLVSIAERTVEAVRARLGEQASPAR